MAVLLEYWNAVLFIPKMMFVLLFKSGWYSFWFWLCFVFCVYCFIKERTFNNETNSAV